MDAPESLSWWWRARARYGPWLLQGRAVTRGRLRDKRFWLDSHRRASAIHLTAEGLPLMGRLRLPARGDSCPALVLVHGSHGPLPLYELLAHRLAQRRMAVLTVDLPGFGGSPAPPVPWTADQFTGFGAVAAAMQHLRAHPRVDSGRISVMGHSFGGSVGAGAGCSLPGVHTTILLGPTRRVSERFVGAGAPEARFWWARFAIGRGLEPWPTLSLVEQVSRMLALEYRDEWRRPGHPPLLLMDCALEAKADLAFLRSLQQGMAPPTRLLTIPAADHYLNSASLGSLVCYDIRALDTCVDAVVDWIDRHPRVSAGA